MKYLYLFFILFFSSIGTQSQTIVIDAGHGYCNDCTQNCTTAVRSDLEILTAMAVSNKLKALLNSCPTVTTFLTRATSNCGDFPTLSQRAMMSNNWNADRFLSVHCNAGGGTGSETFWCNESPSSNIECQNFATEIQNQMVIYGEWFSRRVVEDNTYLSFHLGVLRPTNAVGCLSEIGFVDTTNDAVKLADDGWRDQFAQSYFVSLQNDLSFNCNTNVPDLIIQNMWTDPENPMVEEPTDLYVTFKNAGNAPANAIALEYKINNVTVGTDTHNILAPNESQTMQLEGYEFLDNGNYDFCVFIAPVANEINTLNNSFCIETIVDQPLSIDKFSFKEQLKIYPNPTKGIVNIKNNNANAIKEVMIFDNTGKQVMKVNKNNITKINIEELAQGLYLLQVISTNNDFAVFKILKK